jgi:hypothetical protein
MRCSAFEMSVAALSGIKQSLAIGSVPTQNNNYRLRFALDALGKKEAILVFFFDPDHVFDLFFPCCRTNLPAAQFEEIRGFIRRTVRHAQRMGFNSDLEIYVGNRFVE